MFGKYTQGTMVWKKIFRNFADDYYRNIKVDENEKHILLAFSFMLSVAFLSCPKDIFIEVPPQPQSGNAMLQGLWQWTETKGSIQIADATPRSAGFEVSLNILDTIITVCKDGILVASKLSCGTARHARPTNCSKTDFCCRSAATLTWPWALPQTLKSLSPCKAWCLSKKTTPVNFLWTCTKILAAVFLTFLGKYNNKHFCYMLEIQ